MTTPPPWLEEEVNAEATYIAGFLTRPANAKEWYSEFEARAIAAAKSADWMYATLKPEIDLLVEALRSIQTEINKAPSMVNEDSIAIVCNEILTRHKEKFG